MQKNYIENLITKYISSEYRYWNSLDKVCNLEDIIDFRLKTCQIVLGNLDHSQQSLWNT